VSATRRADALDAAARALSRRDRSRAELDAHLERGGIGAAERRKAAETLERLGYLDDARLAGGRAAALAARGYGDEAIRFDLEGRGIDAELATAAIAALEPEVDRATVIAARLGPGPKTARSLAAKGFSAESVESALGIAADGP
jgi:SOS response regulatory protein OraA/RecX